MYNPTDLLYTQRCACATNILYTQHFLLKIRNSKIRLSVMPTKDRAPFSYISPQKTLFSTIKYELTIEFLSAKPKKSGPPTKNTQLRKELIVICRYSKSVESLNYTAPHNDEASVSYRKMSSKMHIKHQRLTFK